MQLKKTNVQHSARTIYWVVYPWFLSVLEWLLTYRLVTTFFEIGVCPWPDLSSLFQYTSPTPVVSLPLIPRIQFHPGIPVTLLTGSSWIIIVNQIKWNDIHWNTTLKLSFFFLLLFFFITFFILSEFLRLYLLVHGLPCGGGTVFPAMVLDNI